MTDTISFEITAPGRVNLLGEHTDYNGLPVLPMAIDRRIRIVGRSLAEPIVRATVKDETIEFVLADPIPPHPRGSWINYVKAGMQDVLIAHANHRLTGCEIDITGTIPLGVGLSSSSALVVASALALLTANRLDYDPLALAERMARAEHYVGTRGGGMDQTTCLMGQDNCLLKIDFFPLKVQPVPLPDSVTVVICDSLIQARKTEKALHAYNMRSLECRLGVELIRGYFRKMEGDTHFDRVGDLHRSPWNFNYPDMAHLVDDTFKLEYSLAELIQTSGNEEAVLSLLRDYSFTDESEYDAMRFRCGKRLRHVATDAHRVEQSLEYLREGDVEMFGQMMNVGHKSARNDFEISCPELDRLTGLALENGALGARLTGAGFGGCTVNLVYREDAERFCQKMFEEYYAQIAQTQPLERQNVVFATRPSSGARVTEL